VTPNALKDWSDEQMIGGIPIIVDRYICKPEFIRWRRKHRKARINKKWRKKYGAVIACKGVGYEMNMPSITDLWLPVQEKRATTKKFII
jgi:hypothetical protein